MLERDALAAYRLARLVTTDELTDRPRRAAIAWTLNRDHPQVRYLLTCPHCVSVYAAAAVLVLRRLPGGRHVRDVLAVAGAVSLAHDLLEG